MLIVSLSLYCLIPGSQRGNYVWHYQCDTFKGYIGEINIYPDYSHKQMSAPWTLSVHLPFKYKRNHLFSPGSNSHVFKISKDIKFVNASNGCTRALAQSLGKGIIPFCITYTFGLYFFCFASSRSIFCSHTALKKMGVNFFSMLLIDTMDWVKQSLCDIPDVNFVQASASHPLWEVFICCLFATSILEWNLHKLHPIFLQLHKHAHWKSSMCRSKCFHVGSFALPWFVY